MSTSSLNDKDLDMEVARRRFNKRHGKDATDKLMALADEGATLQDMADQFRLSRARMSIIFQELTGQPYSEWLEEQGFRTQRVRDAL